MSLAQQPKPQKITMMTLHIAITLVYHLKRKHCTAYKIYKQAYKNKQFREDKLNNLRDFSFSADDKHRGGPH